MAYIFFAKILLFEVAKIKTKAQYLFTSLRDGEALPTPTPIESIEKDKDAALVNLICVNLDEYARAYDDKLKLKG